MKETYPFKAKPLPYTYDSLEPYISTETLHFHHDKHYQTYVDKLNAALKDYPQFQNLSLENLLKNLNDIPEAIKTAVTNNAGGVYNHELYFAGMTAPSDSVVSNELTNEIINNFTSYEDWKNEMKNAAISVFGSGWAWLVKNNDNGLQIVTTKDQFVPDLNIYTPILLIDVWEHAYYLDYQNLRPNYADNWFKLINWEYLNDIFLNI